MNALPSAAPHHASPPISLSYEAKLPSITEVKEHRLANRLAQILGDDRYVWVDLPPDSDGSPRTAYLKRLEAGYSVHIGSPKELSDVRWTAIERRFFATDTGATPLGGAAELDVILGTIEDAAKEIKNRAHISMVFTTGMNNLRVSPWIPNTGGIEVFLRDFCKALVDAGYRVSVATRGGISHPRTGEPLPDRELLANGVEVFYLDDGNPNSIRKEDLDDFHFAPLIDQLTDRLRKEGVALLCSHYFDGLRIGNGTARSLAQHGISVPHVHVLHSLGGLKRERVTDEEAQALRMPYRLALEEANLPKVDAILATSGLLGRGLARFHPSCAVTAYLPLGIDPRIWHRRVLSAQDPLWETLSRGCSLPVAEVRESKLVVEMGRTVSSKRKDVLIRAFERLHHHDPHTLLVTLIDHRFDPAVARELMDLIDSLPAQVRRAIAVMQRPFDSDQLAALFSAASLYVSPTTTEGWGLVFEEAAACGCLSVTTPEVPFVIENLQGVPRTDVPTALSQRGVVVGEGAAVFPPQRC